MNTLLRLSLAASLFLGVSSTTALAQAAGHVTTGVVEKIAQDTGVMTVRTHQTQRPMTFYGIDKAMLENTQGTQPTLADIGPGMGVTIRYAARNNQWYVEKITYGNLPTVTTGNGPAGVAPAPAPAPQLQPQAIVPTQNTRGGTLGRGGDNGN